MTEGIHFAEAVKGRSLDTLSANELRAKLYAAGITIPDTVKTKEELIALVKKYC